MIGLIDDLSRMCGYIIDNTILLPYTIYKNNKEKQLELALKNDLESFYGKKIDSYVSLAETTGEKKYRIIFSDGLSTELNFDMFKQYLKKE